MEPPSLDWSAAEVRDGRLSVEVSGEPDDDWRATFTRTLALLSSGSSWGVVAFDATTVTVEDVQEGSEENLRFALDGAAQEANAHHAEDDDDGGDDDDEEAKDSGKDSGDDTDKRMTDRFRD